MAETKYASFAPEAIKEPGTSNLWDNADAKVTGFRFTREMPDNYKITPKEGETIDPIGAYVDYEIVGNAPVEERRVNQFFSVGAKVGVSFDIAQGGYALVPKTEDAQLYASNFTKFVRSLVENGLPAPVVASGDFSKIIGLVGHFKRIEDKSREQTTRNFKTKDGTQKSVTEYPKVLLCTKVISLPNAGAATSTSSAPAAAASDEFDLDTATADLLVTALKAKKKPIQRSQIILLVSQQAGQNPNRAVIAKRAADEEFLNNLNELGVVKYEAAAKGQPVSLPEAA